MNELNVVDSSGWLEYFADTDRASLFAAAIEDTEKLIVPVISIYEVFKKVLRDHGESSALHVASSMKTGRVIDLDVSLSLNAARYRLPLADSIIYATVKRFGATLWTQDEDFANFTDVKYFAKA